MLCDSHHALSDPLHRPDVEPPLIGDVSAVDDERPLVAGGQGRSGDERVQSAGFVVGAIAVGAVLLVLALVFGGGS